METLSAVSQKSYLKSAEIARIFNVDHSTVFLWVKKGILRPMRTPGRNFRFSQDAVRKIFNERINAKSTNKRTTPRFKVDYPVVVEFSQCDHLFNASITGISSHGLSLSVSDDGTLLRKLEQSESSTLLIFNKQHTLLRDRIEARVRHFKRLDDTTITVGLTIQNPES